MARIFGIVWFGNAWIIVQFDPEIKKFVHYRDNMRATYEPNSVILI
jgi:hypothetical protein